VSLLFSLFGQLTQSDVRLFLRTPLYYPAKIALLVAMLNPSTEVKDKLFTKIVQPFVQHHRQRIDEALYLGTKKARQAWDMAWAYALRLLRTFLAAVWFSSQQHSTSKNNRAGDDRKVVVARAPPADRAEEEVVPGVASPGMQ